MDAGPLSLREYTSAQLIDLCDAVGFRDTDRTSVELLEGLLGPAGPRKLSEPPMWPSDVADDTTPVEFSIAFDDNGERLVRVLGETFADCPGPAANLVAARRLLHVLAERFPISLDRFHAVQDLFLPEQPQGKFALWYSFIFQSHSPPKFKIYFNPAVRGADRAPHLVAEALDRLGLRHAYGTATEYAFRCGDLDEFSFFALDLDDRPGSRVKLYFSHEAADVEHLERAANAVDGVDPARVGDFCSLVGGDGPFTGRPVVSSYSFTDSVTGRPSNYSVYLPIRSYVSDDGEARDRVRALLEEQRIEPAVLDRAVAAVSGRELTDGVGLIAHVSLRLGPERSGTTVYLSSEAYDVMPPRRPVVAV